jgi:hypothetical protein
MGKMTKRTHSILIVLVAVALVAVAATGCCGLKPRTHGDTTEPAPVVHPADEGEGVPDIDQRADGEAVEQEAPLPMDTEFIEWDVEVDSAPKPGRIADLVARKVTFRLTNTLDRLLTGQIVLEPPRGVSVLPGTTIGWRLRAEREAEIPAHITILEGAPLGRVEVPLTINVRGQEYRRARLELYKWFDVRIVGPFPPGAGAGAAYPPDEKVDFDRAYEWHGVTYAWRALPIDALQPDCMIDFQQIFGESAAGTAYAALRVRAEAVTGVVLAFACDGPSVVSLNGQTVLNAPEPLNQEKAVEVTLRKGPNTLLVKCTRGDGGWACTLNVLGKLGELPSGVTFDLVLRGVLEREPVTVEDESQSVEDGPEPAQDKADPVEDALLGE